MISLIYTRSKSWLLNVVNYAFIEYIINAIVIINRMEFIRSYFFLTNSFRLRDVDVCERVSGNYDN